MQVPYLTLTVLLPKVLLPDNDFPLLNRAELMQPVQVWHNPPHRRIVYLLVVFLNSYSVVYIFFNQNSVVLLR